jgi:hypothetical protein
MKMTIVVPALAGIAGFVGARASGIESGVVQLVVAVACMVVAAIVVLWKGRCSSQVIVPPH